MIRNKSFEASLKCPELQAAFIELDGPHRALVGIGNYEGKTIGQFDTKQQGNRKITLEAGGPTPRHSGSVIATGSVYIDGRLETITAYRDD